MVKAHRPFGPGEAVTNTLAVLSSQYIRSIAENNEVKPTLFTPQAPTQASQQAWHRLDRFGLFRNLTVLPDIVKSVGATPFFSFSYPLR